jgi:hypothetical protein
MPEALALLVDEYAKDLFQKFIVKQTDKTDKIICGRAGHVTGWVAPTIWQSTLFFASRRRRTLRDAHENRGKSFMLGESVLPVSHDLSRSL